LKEMDKHSIFAKKTSLREIPDFKSVFINPELTKFQRTREGKLREAGKKFKADTQGTKFLIRNGIMKVITNGNTKIFTINEDDEIIEIRASSPSVPNSTST